MAEEPNAQEPEITPAGEVELDEDQLGEVAGGLTVGSTKVPSLKRRGPKVGSEPRTMVLGKGPVPS